MLKTAKDQRLALLEKDMQKILVTAAKYLQEKLPLKNSWLYCVRCLNPALRKELCTNDIIMSLVPLMPQVSGFDTSFSDKVCTEWFLYQHDTDIMEAWWKDTDGVLLSVDKYWAKVFQLKDAVGQPVYLHLSLIVKVAFS